MGLAPAILRWMFAVAEGKIAVAADAWRQGGGAAVSRLSALGMRLS
jgi:hypothetical protein